MLMFSFKEKKNDIVMTNDFQPFKKEKKKKIQGVIS